MKIKTKILLGSGLMTLIPLLIVSLVIGWQSINEGEKALQEQIQNRLIALRDDKKSQIENYFKITQDQLITFSKDQMFIDASMAFKDAFTYYNDEFLEGSIDPYKVKLENFYLQDFTTGFKQLNPEKEAVVKVIDTLSEQGITLQYQYIANNKAPLMKKDDLLNPEDDTLYAQIHSLYHKKIREFNDRFHFSDIYLVDPETGNIIYSVNKKIDFASSLKEGVFAGSSLGKVFKQANQAKQEDFVILTDFTPYLPSLNKASAFIASPIFDDDEKKGILIFQLNTETINQIMTSSQKWQQVGMGESGESYLVGADMKARSINRGLIQDSENYFSLLKQVQSNQAILESIKNHASNVLQQTISTPGVQAALSGKNNFMQFSNALKIPVLSAYAPLKIASLNWAILAEISVAEALSPVQSLKKTIASSVFSILLIMLTLSVVAGLLFSQLITRPIVHLSNVIKDVEQTSDLTQRINLQQNDEIGTAAQAFDKMLLKFHNSIQEVSHSVNYFTNATDILKQNAERTNSTIARQNKETSQIALSIGRMMEKSQDVTAHTDFASQATHETRGEAKKGQQSVLETIDSINQVADQIEQSATVIHKLESDSNNIGSVVNVIRDIAEQTNLLALNAAIEAARAGEMGRGFAVVADEVRQLASRTQDATTEIQKLIESLQHASKDAVQVMDSSKSHTLDSVKQAQHSGQVLNTVTHSIEAIDEKNLLIKQAVNEQADFAQEINQNIETIVAEGEKTSISSKEITTSSDILFELSDKLQILVQQFKISGLPKK
ncbi:MAG: methyl-accepting chemotaxis protein [gamma proteobacterium symbiont of Taylorina sp.]|nr:methyl-accepting chemotaxis protein [gamma proteobacterium symbiont of Taylorina sp.]